VGRQRVGGTRRRGARLTDAEQGEALPATALAPSTSGPELLAEHLVVDAGALLLVSVRRPADVVAALGWWGATNHDYSGADITAVLRSWEDRFGAVLVTGFDTMVVQVPRNTASPSAVDGLLREHYGFCTDIIDGAWRPTPTGPG
jgi:hypothetical protein